ncbi:alpha/beta hydrolase [Synechococcus sp. CB0101]|uniref:lipase family alpha/beta hydrolase n=1 Tax=Synechococcus sp. CB0101 TaxID=232348 RepID=UPI000200243B
MVHGLLDTPAVFGRLRQQLAGRRELLISPALPLRLGRTSVQEAARLLDRELEWMAPRFGVMDVLGFSMGGVIARTWIQRLGGERRTRRFISLGSPQQGTWTAQPWSSRLFPGLADLKPGSPLLQGLNSDLEGLRRVECHSFYSALDLAVVPAWSAVLPVGSQRVLPVATHPQLLRDPAALAPLVAELLRD